MEVPLNMANYTGKSSLCIMALPLNMADYTDMSSLSIYGGA